MSTDTATAALSRAFTLSPELSAMAVRLAIEVMEEAAEHTPPPPWAGQMRSAIQCLRAIPQPQRYAQRARLEAACRTVIKGYAASLSGFDEPVVSALVDLGDQAAVILELLGVEAAVGVPA